MGRRNDRSKGGREEVINIGILNRLSNIKLYLKYRFALVV